MKKVIHLYKTLGKTPLETIEDFRLQNSDYKDVKMAYAGRLDPMARGDLIVLVDEECKNRDKYQGLDKEYFFSVLVGVETDTYDALGVISSLQFTVDSLQKSEGLELRVEGVDETSKIANLKSQNQEPVSNLQSLVSILKNLTGRIVQKYPSYSSFHVNGKPLFWWAREGRLGEIEIPTKDVTVFSLDLIYTKQISSKSLLKNILRKIDMVHGDFRQEEIKESWTKFLRDSKNKKFTILRCKAKVSSGTYVRSLAHEIGKKLGNRAIALDIYRSKVFLN